MLINSQKYDGMTSDQAIKEIVKDLIDTGSGEELIQFRLRDWGVSRQRYWGCPIPVIYEDEFPKVINETEMPVELPALDQQSLPKPLSQNKNFTDLGNGLQRE